LVEDDTAVRSAAVAVLRRAGHTVIEASNGIEALRIVEDDATAIDIVISDMVMPGMGGRTLAAELEQRRPHVPVLLMSGYTREAIPGRGELHPSRAFIEKPFTPESLAKSVREVLDRSRESKRVQTS
jgi:DNA-binding NtrC family response regulator